MRASNALRRLGGIADTRSVAKAANMTSGQVRQYLNMNPKVVAEQVDAPAVYQGDPDHEFFRIVNEFRVRCVDGFSSFEVAQDLDVPMDRVRLVLRTVHDNYRAVELTDRYRRTTVYRLTE